MATKANRILDLLPGTFAAQPSQSPLLKLVQTYGGELQSGENALAAIMRSHWCEQADLGAQRLDDLPKLAALYGLAPHPDDGIEEFRRRLKLWVRLILEGPATVRGLLRASSILTALEIDDDDSAFDAWWHRDQDVLTTARFSGRDAGPAVFGFEQRVAVGTDAEPARISGIAGLSDSIDLGSNTFLRIAVDGDAPATVDFAAAPAVATPADIVERINDDLGAGIARLFGARLDIVSPTTGAASTLGIEDGPKDAAHVLLGLPPRRVSGSAAQAATFDGVVDLSGGADLSVNRFLRLRVDGTNLAEIDCAGADPAATALDEVVNAINAALGLSVASHDGRMLSLSSPTTGKTSSVAFLAPAAQDAAAALFGPHPTVITGADASPAVITGTADLSSGVDLSGSARLVISYDAEPAVEVDVAGTDPERTQLPEIVAAINSALAADIARHNGRNLILNGLDAGPSGSLEVGQADEGDASLNLLGLPPRRVAGRDARRATLHGLTDLTEGVSLAARPLLRLGIDHRPPQTFDLSSAAAKGPLDAAAIATALAEIDGTPQSLAEDGRLVLRSAAAGSTSRIELHPIAASVARRFVSRVPIAEDAARTAFGMLNARAAGTAATAARLAGARDLRRGVDLSAGRFLRLSVDGADPVDIDCAGPRPRNTTSEEVLDALNGTVGTGIATLSPDGRLTLTSPATGTPSHLALSPPRAADALNTILGVGPITAQGRAASQVSFAGTVDLSAGVDLAAASRLRLAFDDGDPVEIDCAGPDPAATTPAQIAIAINVALGHNVASHDGAHVLLTSPTRGAASKVAILAPDSDDATAVILGIEPERRYRGTEALAAEIRGLVDLSGGVDLTVSRFLRLGFDTAAPVDIDCAAEAESPSAVTPGEIATAINAALPKPVASIDTGHLILRAPGPGASSRLVVEETLSGDAAPALFGSVPTEASGEAAAPARLIGGVDLRNGVDLSERSVLRLSLNDGPPMDIDIAGEAPEVTAPDEITAAINARFPAKASISPDGHLTLTASGSDVLDLLPLRYFELIDYPCEPAIQSASGLIHGDAIFVSNSGAAAAAHDIELTAADGAASPGLVNLETGWVMRLGGAVPPGATVTVSTDETGLAASMTGGDGHLLPGPRVEGLPLLPNLAYPSDASRAMAAGTTDRRQIVLSGQGGSDLIQLTEIGRSPVAPRITLTPAERPPEEVPDDHWPGRLVEQDEGLALIDSSDAQIAVVKPVSARSTADLVGVPVVVRGKRTGLDGASEILAERIDALVDLRVQVDDIPSVTEEFAGLALAADGPLSIVAQINSGATPSGLVIADTIDRIEALTIPRGAGRRIYVDCLAARFDAAVFDRARFAGGPCLEQGIFNVSRFAETPRADSTPVFAPVSGGGTADVSLRWQSHTTAAAEINLPRDMPARFGARFDMDRFALTQDAPETITGLVTEPPGDPEHFAAQLAEGSSKSYLITAKSVTTVPIGFAPVELPFARPKALTGGRADRAARLYLADPGVPGFIELSASLPGKHGNRISVVICDSAPGRFDLLVSFGGARFENARLRVLGPDLSGKPGDLSEPGPRGVLHLKAGGVRILVTRDGTPPETLD